MAIKPHYVIIGDGKVAQHTLRYLTQLNLSVAQWSRKTHAQEALASIVEPASHVLVLLRDDVIESFIKNNLSAYDDKLIVHFSGSLVTDHACSAHPLMTFTDEHYALSLYQTIWFVIEQDGPAFSELLPGLPNPSAAIPKNEKALYHSLCVMSGNFTCLLWQKMIQSMQDQWGIPQEAAFPYLEQIMKNITADPHTALTGPLPRGDKMTLAKNIKALDNDPYQHVYQAFVQAYQQQEVMK